MIYNSIKEYLAALLKWTQQPIVITGGLVWVNGNSYTPSEFYATNPKPRFEPSIDLNNPDKTVIQSGVKTRKK